eukprot:6188805-Pleurochrysis_carterae.AAC.1
MFENSTGRQKLRPGLVPPACSACGMGMGKVGRSRNTKCAKITSGSACTAICRTARHLADVSRAKVGTRRATRSAKM